MKALKRFAKEIKRVKWPSGKSSLKTFGLSFVFIVASSLFLFALALLFGTIWSDLGVGLNG